MTSAAAQKMQVSCPQCTQQLMVPLSAAGKTGRCPSCGFTFTLLEQAAPPAMRSSSPSSGNNPFRDLDGYEQPVSAAANNGFPQPDQQSPEQSAFPSITAESVTQKARRAEAADEGGTFAPEKKGLQAGVAGGLLMMVIAVVWFFGGLALGRIFFYPPILFIVGLVGFFKGLATGNMASNRRRY
jgi:hypothetical protein